MSAAVKHTPGPWKVVVPRNPLNGFTHAIVAPSGAVAWAFPPGDEVALADANARLIASAPVLLAACRDLLGAFEDGVNQCCCANAGYASPAPCVVCRTRAAIAKASGG